MNYFSIHDVKSIKAKRTIHDDDFQILVFSVIDDEGRETRIQFFMDESVVIDFEETDTDRSYE